jgi:hypothetical protein
MSAHAPVHPSQTNGAHHKDLPRRHGVLSVIILLISLFHTGCLPVVVRHQLPEQLAEQAIIPGIPYARFWGDKTPENMEARLDLLLEHKRVDDTRPISMLAISGGGANGAFGAGLLKGWTEAGDRPEFHFVTGISTGALIAPFAFIGSQMDAEMEKFYTTTSTKDLLIRRNRLLLLSIDSATDSSPLRNILLELFSPEFIEAIANEHRKGRRLFIGTTHLDAGRPMIWNIGSIALSGRPDARELMADIFLASASIPGVFPPVLIQVEADGEKYDEMHVDGGTVSQVFSYPPSLNIQKLMEDQQLKHREVKIYVIRNSMISPTWVSVAPRIPAIAQRSIGVLIRFQGVGDVNQIYMRAKRDNIDFNLAFIPPTFDMKANEEFDPVFMRALFDVGYQLGREGYDWKKVPVGFE